MSGIRVSGKEFRCKLVIFDMDGTLVDARARFLPLAKARAQSMRELAGKEAMGHWARLSGVDLKTGYLDAHGPLVRAPRREDIVVGATAIYLTGRKWREARELAEQIYNAADQMLVHGSLLYDGVDGALRIIKGSGLKMALATNDGRSAAENMMRSQGIHGLFDAIVGADDVQNPKPAPDMILMACERCDFTPSQAVFVGDMMEDMLAGRAASVGGLVAVRSDYSSEEEVSGFADVVIKSVAEINPL